MYLWPKRKPTLLALILSLLLYNFAPKVAAQTASAPQLTDAERKEAQQLSTTFTKRLGETLDFGIVMNELFLPDAVERYVANEKRKAERDSKLYRTLPGNSPSVFFWPGMLVESRTLETASVDDWRRLYVATANFFLLGFVRMMRGGDLQKTSLDAFYPRSVVGLVNRNPLLRNFIQKKDLLRPLKSAAEMQSAAATLEQANTMLRKDVPPTPNLEELVIQAGVRAVGKTKVVTQQELESARSKMISAETADSEMLGFPKGTRLVMIATFTTHIVVAVKIDSALKIAWVFPFTG